MTDQVVVVGGALIDLILEIPPHYLTTHGQGSAISLPYGAKLVAKDYRIAAGGSGANVAAGLSRAGYDVTLRTNLSSDPLAGFIREELAKFKVALLEGTTQGPTAVSVVLRAKGDRTIITGSSGKTELLNVEFPETGWIHLGPLPEKADQFLQKISSHQLKTNQGLSVNPSMVQIEERSRSLLALLRMAEIIFLNLEEALRLTRLPQRSQIADIVRSVHALGVKIICVTQGEKGAFVSNGNHIWFAEAVCDKSSRADATGAGDAFAAGFLAGYIKSTEENDEEMIQKCLKMAMLNSGSVVEQIGAQAGLLSATEIERDLGAVNIRVVK